MTDYISRQAALNEISMAECGLEYKSCKNCSCSHIGRIRDIPAADVVEVVRCNDCSFCLTEECPCDLSSGDDYCSYGERADK